MSLNRVAQFFEKRGFQNANGYAWFVFALAVFSCMAISIVISVAAGNRAIAKAEAAERAEREATRRDACMVIREINEAYHLEPPDTEVGKNVARAWEHLSEVFRCNER